MPNALETAPEAANLLKNATTMTQIVQAHILPVLSNARSVLNPLQVKEVSAWWLGDARENPHERAK